MGIVRLGVCLYYPLEVNSMKYCCLGVFRNIILQARHQIVQIEKKTLKYWYTCSWVVKMINTEEAV